MPSKNPPIHQINDFNIGMNPNVYDVGIPRIEHFDTITGQARPYRALVASTMTSDDVSMKDLTNFTLGTSNTLYALGKENSSNYGAMARWDTSTYRWFGFQSFNEAGTQADVLHFFQGNLYGLRKGTNLWKMTTAGTFSPTHVAQTYTTYTNFITHSKDDTVYFGADNAIKKFDGTNITNGVTLTTNFIITSIAEHGDYIIAIGYDSQTLKATAYLWDRDSSLATTTQKYDLFYEVPLINATLGGEHFVIATSSSEIATSSTAFPSKRLHIRYLSGDKFSLKNSFSFSSLVIKEHSHFIDGDKLYFNATVKFIGDSASHFVVFQVDELGNLSIVQNIAINDSGSVSDGLPGIIRFGDNFWIAGRTDGSWHSASTYPSVSAQSSFFETPKYRAKDLTQNLDFVRSITTWESLPANGQVLLKTRGDGETSWTTLATFTTDSSVKGTINKQGCATIPSIAKERQFRIESTGGAVITGFQAEFEEVDNQS